MKYMWLLEIRLPGMCRSAAVPGFDGRRWIGGRSMAKPERVLVGS
jgi:hypothetical protein